MGGKRAFPPFDSQEKWDKNSSIIPKIENPIHNSLLYCLFAAKEK